jgi:hypothetical protein
MPHEVVLIEIGCDRPELNEPIGLCTIAKYLSQEASISDEQILLLWEKFPNRRARPEHLQNASLVGISAQIRSLARARDVYAMIRSVAPSVPIVIGNLLAIYAAGALLEEFPDAILCTGEGEATFAEVYSLVKERPLEMLDRKRLRSVPGLMFVADGKLVQTSPKLVDLGKLPPPRRDFTSDLVSAKGITRIEASRGCHWGRCEFCSVASRFGLGGYRRFPTSRVIADLEALAASGASSPYFSDEDFFGGRYEESRRLADAIILAKYEGRIPTTMNFFISVLSSDVKHPLGRAALLRWKEAGLREVFIGVEAGADDEIRRFAKKANSDTNSTAIYSLLAMGFQVDIGFIMFDPMMAFEDLEENVEWLLRQPLDSVDSRVTKSLRIQPRTGLETKYGELISGPLNIDELTYPNTFADERVGRVEARFREWEKRSRSDIYALLSAGRGEIGSEENRIARKRELALIRNIDLEFLQALIRQERDTCSTWEVDVLTQTLSSHKFEMIEHGRSI